MRRLIIICGSTATGKTGIAIKLSKKFNGEIISADSRQVYEFMDIGTGKDLPENSKIRMINNKLGFYIIDNIRIWGYDLVRPDQEFSVKHYRDFANFVIKDIYSRGKIPILVGGTGLYLDAITHNLDFISIPRDLNLRKKISEYDAKKLFQMLVKIKTESALKLNQSDKNNPRRLVRAIEIAKYQLKTGKPISPTTPNYNSLLWIGLTLDGLKIRKRIDQRVKKRIKLGFETEVENLIAKNYLKAMKQTLGYKSFLKYKSGGR